MSTQRRPRISEDERRYRWPGIDHAYDYVLPSYQWMIARLDAAEARIQSLLTFVATVTLGVPTLVVGKLPGTDMLSPLAVAGFLFGIAALTMGLWVRWRSGVQLPAPDMLWRRWTRRPEQQFKARMLRFAAEAYTANERLLDRKVFFSFVMTVLFLGELALFWLWVALP